MWGAIFKKAISAVDSKLGVAANADNDFVSGNGLGNEIGDVGPMLPQGFGEERSATDQQITSTSETEDNRD